MEIKHMFDSLDPKVFDSPDYKEDSVREEIIAPIIKRLGFKSSGADRVIRSKNLVHPYVMIGSKKHPVNIIPDYTLLCDEEPYVILEAKGPNASIKKSNHVEQAYSYAIHPDIRANIYGLCNGREIVIYAVSQFEPLLDIKYEDIERNWENIVRLLSPHYLRNSHLRDFALDYGMTLRKLGYDDNLEQLIVGHFIQCISMVEPDLFTASTSTSNLFESGSCLLSIDLNREQVGEIIKSIPSEVAQIISRDLSHAPFMSDLAGKLILSVSGRLGALTQGEHEQFVPIVVDNIVSVHYDPTIKLV
jgi:hypothetical protein